MGKYRRSLSIKLSDQVAKSLLYALPKVAVTSLFVPINIVQGIYAKHYGMALTTIASVILFARAFDAFTDPIVGFLSDKSRITRGTRKPTMVLGAIVLAASGYCLYAPTDDVTALYFILWFMVFYVGYTLFEIPHLAWGGEISTDTHQKSQTYTLRTIAAYSGVALFYGIPLLPVWETTEITPETLEFSAIASGLLLLPLLYLCMKNVPDGWCFSEEKPLTDINSKPTETQDREFVAAAKNMLGNKPLLLFLGAFLFAGGGLGMWYGLIFIYVDAYLGMGMFFAKISLIALAISILGAFFWLQISKYLGKKWTWLLAMILAIATFFSGGLLNPENATYERLLMLVITFTLCLVCIESLPQSMLSDIIDYSTWKLHSYQGSTYFSVYLFIYKLTIGVGGALGLAIAGWHGFDPSSTSQTSTGITGLKLAMTWLPTLLVVISMIFITLSPITASRHGVIRRRLNSIEARYKKKDYGKDPTLNQEIAEITLTT